ncbi:folylpolyglutamate synthase-like protein [Xylaria digitata]|nr:folylpolyglutamate synthase-like protein [Xylaria digitata]
MSLHRKTEDSMSFQLRLERITALLKNTPQSWKAIHVAGTNGKGSICAYVHAMMRAKNISCGRFTSPHLVDRWDCITINDRPVSETKFHHFEKIVTMRSKKLCLDASPFELLTAAAFEIFENEKVQFGIIEVGLGGSHDATNALKHKAVTVISKIGLDHQDRLGSTLAKIAAHKAGILRRGVPCVVDPSNDPTVLSVVLGRVIELGSTAYLADPGLLLGVKFPERFEPHQRQNLLCAQQAFNIACPEHAGPVQEIVNLGAKTVWPGRLQSISIEKITKRQKDILLDGAHNPQSAEVLSAFVEKRLRAPLQKVTWVLAATEGKDISEMLKKLLRDGDNVAVVEFGPVDGMPWVRPTKSATILQTINKIGISTGSLQNSQDDVMKALTWASEISREAPLVVAGSLYLVSNVLKLLRA